MKKNFKIQSFILITGLLLVSCLPANGQIDNNFWNNQKKAFAAGSTAECKSSLKFCIGALKVVPNHPVINYLAARLNAQLGNKNIALEQLKKATELGYTTKLPFNKIHQLNDSAFVDLRKEEGFRQIIKALEKSEKPVHNSQIAFILREKDLVPEGITYDPVEKMFYLGSETKNKIVKVDHDGNCADFTRENQDGLTYVLGIHVDPVRRTIWACSYKKNKQAVFKYNLLSGRLIKKYLLPPDDSGKYFNDLVIHSNGDVFLSEPGGHSIYIIPHSSDKLELFFKHKYFIGPNGITLSEDKGVIFVGTNAGICKIDIKTKSFSFLTHGEDFNTYGIDGLYFADNSLHAVQISINQISKFTLNKNFTHIESCKIFERNSPYLHRPTTGVIVDDYFYFIADTEGKAYKQEGVIVMKTPLNK